MEQKKSGFKNSISCAGLVAHIKDIKKDVKLLKADVLHLDETHIKEDDEVVIKLEGFDCHHVSAGKGKGITTYKKETLNILTTSIKESRLQIVKASLDEVDSINVYKSGDKSVTETLEVLGKLINPDRTTLITGDFNICFRKNPKNSLTTYLEKKGFSQLQKEATQIMGGHIDHVYWLDPWRKWHDPEVERYSVYYSDHDSILISLSKKADKKSKLSRRKQK